MLFLILLFIFLFQEYLTKPCLSFSILSYSCHRSVIVVLYLTAFSILILISLPYFSVTCCFCVMNSPVYYICDYAFWQFVSSFFFSKFDLWMHLLRNHSHGSPACFHVKILLWDCFMVDSACAVNKSFARTELVLC